MRPALRSRWGRVLAGAILIPVLAITGLGRRGATDESRGAGAATNSADLVSPGTAPSLSVRAGLGLPQSVAPPASPTSSSPEPSDPTAGTVDGPAGTVAGTPVVNASDGAVDDVGARRLAAAYLTSVQWTVRAVELGDPTILDILFPAANRDTGTETLIANLRAARATARYTAGRAPNVTRLIVTALTAAQQQQIESDSGVIAGPLALVVTYQGPVDLSITWPGTPSQTYPVVASGREITELSLGGVIDDPRLGTVWRETYSRDCTAHPDPVVCA